MKKIVVIGAGPAGLTAAYELLSKSKDFTVTILEKDAVAGGLSKTYKFEGGQVDIGGHRFFTKSETISELWENILPYNEKGMLLRQRKSHILWNSKVIEYPIKLNLQTISAVGIKKGTEILLSYFLSKLSKKKINTLEDFYISRFGKRNLLG